MAKFTELKTKIKPFKIKNNDKQINIKEFAAIDYDITLNEDKKEKNILFIFYNKWIFPK